MPGGPQFPSGYHIIDSHFDAKQGKSADGVRLSPLLHTFVHEDVQEMDCCANCSEKKAETILEIQEPDACTKLCTALHHSSNLSIPSYIVMYVERVPA